MTDEIESAPAEEIVDKNVAIVANNLAEPKDNAEQEETKHEELEGDSEPNDEDSDKRKLEKGYNRQRKRADRNLFKYEQQRARADAAERRVAELQSQLHQTGREPQEEDFTTYGDYLKAVARYEARQENNTERLESAKADAKQARDELTASEQERSHELRTAFDESGVKAASTIADFNTVMDEYFPQNGEKAELSNAALTALIETDDSAFGLYSILKNGLLDEFNSLSPYKAAAMLAIHTKEAIQQSKTRKVSNAPEPITPARGSGSASKDVTQMTDAEYEADYRKRKYKLQ